MGWLHRNSESLEAVGTIVTALVAIVALFGVKYQIDATAKIQQEQSARDIYREYLAISIQNPEFVTPDVCNLMAGPQAPAYASYVHYTLYTAEQAIAADSEWFNIFENVFADHSVYFCEFDQTINYTTEVENLLNRTRIAECPVAPTCSN